jgi:HEPN domain-containing protein
MARKFKTVSVSKEDSGKYLNKALEFLAESNRCLSDQKWNCAGLLAIHTAISAVDSILGYVAGCRSSSSDHGDTVELVRQQLKHIEESSKQANRLSRILGKKNLVEYEAREVSQKEAAYLVEQAERFVDWVRGVMGES